MDESDDNCCILPLLLGATKAPAVEARRERRRHFIVALLSCLLGSERPYGALNCHRRRQPARRFCVGF